MYTQLQLLRFLQEEHQNHKRLIKQMERTKQLMPEGYLAKCNNSYYHMIKHGDKKEQIIIPPGYAGRDQLISDLQEKRFINKSLPLLKNNFKYLQALESNYQIYSPDMICCSLPEVYHDFDYNHLMLDDDFSEDWFKNVDSQNPAYRDNLKHQSEGGLLTRSKAEAMIATKLEQEGILFRYEPSLWLGNHHLFPDFGALHQYERRLIYWEHFGMMDNPKYAHSAMDKLRIYSEYGICLGDNLIITWETSDAPLTYAHISDRISRYLCCKK